MMVPVWRLKARWTETMDALTSVHGTTTSFALERALMYARFLCDAAKAGLARTRDGMKEESL